MNIHTMPFPPPPPKYEMTQSHMYPKYLNLLAPILWLEKPLFWQINYLEEIPYCSKFEPNYTTNHLLISDGFSFTLFSFPFSLP